GHFHGSVGETGAAFIKANQAAELAEAFEKKGAPRYFPVEIEMGHRAGRPDHIKWAIPGNLIGDADIAAARVLCLGQDHIIKKSRVLSSRTGRRSHACANSIGPLPVRLGKECQRPGASFVSLSARNRS